MPTLEEEYQNVIDTQRAYLLKLQEEFNAACDAIKEKAQAAGAKLPQEDKEGRKQILEQEGRELQAELAKLKQAVHGSTRDTMKKLEGIQRRREQEILAYLEKQLEQVAK